MNNFEISGNIVDILKEKIYSGTVTVTDGKIDNIMENSETYSNYILPGLIDSHIHIESSMLPPSEFARLACVHGTVATVSDPHEIANVLGINGVEFMIENGKKVPFKFYFGASPCVPATTFETAGATLTPDDLKTLYAKDGVKYMSEMMNFPGVLFKFDDIMKKIEITKEFGLPIDGHAPALRGENLKQYIEAGISTDHEAVGLEEAEERIKYGMKVQIREGAPARSFAELHPLIAKYPEMCMFCCDDLSPEELVQRHINLIIKMAIEKGYNIIDVLKIAVKNPVEHYKLDVGMLQFGDPADFIVVDNLKDFNILKTYIDGELVAENGKSLIKRIETEPINNFEAEKKTIEDFHIESTGEMIRVIEAIDNSLFTEQLICPEKVENGNIVSDVEKDILKFTVVNRYANTAPALAFIKNFGLKRGAIASSVGHDSHNILAVGTSDEQLCKAVNAIIEHKGGMVVVDGDDIDILPFPIAGLMATMDAYEVAEKYLHLENKAKTLGSKLTVPFMTLSFMALLVIPKIKLSDQGLFDGEKFQFINLKAN